MTALSVVDLERLATDATARELDVVLVLAEVVPIVAHGDDWIIAGDVHLSLGVSGWHGTVAVPPMQVGTARMGGRR